MIDHLKILHLISSHRWTGAAEPAGRLAAEQIQQGHNVEMIAVGGSSIEKQLNELGVPLIQGFNLDRHVGRVGFFFQDVKLLCQLVEERDIDIIHAHLPHDHWIAAMALRRPFGRYTRKARPALVRSLYREAPPRRDPAHRWLVGKGADMILTSSQSMRQALVEDVGVPNPKVRWVCNGVDLERFHPTADPLPIRDLYGIPHDIPVAGMIARMQPGRGHEVLIDVIDEVLAAVPNAVVALAGRGEMKHKIIHRIEAHRQRDHLRRIGYHHEDLPQLYAAMDVTVLLKPGSDGSCRAMLESMACARPVIGARIGALADAIQTGENGWLVTPGDRRDLARALIEALANLEATRQKGEAARAYVERRHTRASQCASTIEIYHEALERRATKFKP